MMLCAIWYHLYNFKKVNNTHGGVLLLLKILHLHGCFCVFWIVQMVPNRATHHILFHSQYVLSLRIESECGKIRTRNSSVFGHFSHSEINPFHVTGFPKIFWCFRRKTSGINQVNLVESFSCYFIILTHQRWLHSNFQVLLNDE